MIRYLEKSIENMRDIGGYKTTLGKQVKTGKIIRSNLPKKLSSENIDYIKQIGISSIIDLRSFEEIEVNKSIFENNSNFKVYHIGINIGKNIPVNSGLVPKSYVEMLDLKEKFKTIFKILADNDKVLYFCSAGKDRTGVVTALILKLLGVSDKDIINDYMATKDFMEKSLKEYAGSDANILNIITPKEMYIQKFLKEFTNRYSTVEKYLMEAGLEKQTIEVIKEKYIEF